MRTASTLSSSKSLPWLGQGRARAADHPHRSLVGTSLYLQGHRDERDTAARGRNFHGRGERAEVEADAKRQALCARAGGDAPAVRAHRACRFASARRFACVTHAALVVCAAAATCSAGGAGGVVIFCTTTSGCGTAM